MAAAALALTGTVAATTAQAGTVPPFGIDGTVPDVLVPPLTPLSDPSGSLKELGPKNSSVTKIGVINRAATPMLEKTNPNAQVDLRQAWLTTARDSQNEVWLYFAWERDSNSGSGFIAYEFMKNAAPAACAYDSASEADLIASCNPWANRSAGDFMILWDQSGSSKVLYLRTWSGTAPNLTLSAPQALNADVSAAAFSADGFKGEAAVNLSDTVFKDTTGCLSFANTIPSTVTGNSDTADYKDTILKQAPPISNCGSLIVKKIVINDNGGTKVASDFTFKVNGGNATSFIQDGTDPLKGRNTIPNQNGTFNVTEPAVAGYTTTYDNCSNMVVGPGQDQTCTITNNDEPGTLVVKKQVINDDGGTKIATDFSFKVNGGTATSFTQDGSETLKGKNSMTVNAGTYTVTEPAVSGYTSDVSDCASVVVPNGGIGECTITNNDQPGTLVVHKVVVNDSGGSKSASDFSFDYGLDGSGTTTNQVFNANGTNSITVDAGTYDASEIAPDGYTMTGNTCDNVVVPNGGTGECTITNNDKPGTLIVHKVVINDNGGTAGPNAFSFNYGLDGSSTTTNQVFNANGTNSITVNAGTYDATETPPSGYLMTSNTCDNVVVPNGGIGECTITNDDQQATLIVHKLVINNNGGTAKPDDFVFGYGLDGGTVTNAVFNASGTNTITVNAGTYDAVETPPSGYLMTGNTCDNVVVPNGGSGECTITNDDQPGTLIVNKVVVNDNGGTATADDFSFEYGLDGGSTTPATFEADGSNSFVVDAGKYDATETPVTGYTMTGNTCDDVVVPNGGTGECTITNNDTKASPSGSTTQRWVLHDSLTIVGLRTGAPDAASEVTFTLYSDDSCSTKVGSDEQATLSGTTASTTNGVAVSSEGTYYWRVSYPGDQFNNAFTTACGSETTTITAFQ